MLVFGEVGLVEGDLNLGVWIFPELIQNDRIFNFLFPSEEIDEPWQIFNEKQPIFQVFFIVEL